MKKSNKFIYELSTFKSAIDAIDLKDGEPLYQKQKEINCHRKTLHQISCCKHCSIYCMLLRGTFQKFLLRKVNASVNVHHADEGYSISFDTKLQYMAQTNYQIFVWQLTICSTENNA